MKNVIFMILKFYKKLLSPYIPMACRFYPTCSVYMQQAVEQHGVGYGLLLGIGRLCRCHPWGGDGADCVPTFSAQTQGFKKLTAITDHWRHGRKLK